MKITLRISKRATHSHRHPNLLELDVSALSAVQAAANILECAFKLKNNNGGTHEQ
jgi:hypothetical protein